MKRRLTFLAVFLVALAAITFVVLRKVQRADEWAHGGDRMAVAVDVQLADRATFGSVTAGLGVPPDKVWGLAKSQAVVAKVSWTGWVAGGDGEFLVVALDRRLSPPRVLVGENGWTPTPMSGTPTGRLGASWVSAYDHVLAERYDWMAGFQAVRLPNAFYTETHSVSPAVGIPARESGTAFVEFSAPENAPQVTQPGDVILGLIYVQGPSMGRAKLESYVRWARRIYG